MVQPGGPSIHFVISPGFVCASQTSWRGALNVRTTRTSRSLGNVTSRDFCIVFSLQDSHGVFARRPEDDGERRAPTRPTLFSASFAFGRLAFEFFEQRI